MTVYPLGSTETYVGDSLIAGDFPRVTKTVTILSGQVIARGTLLGQITAGGKFIKSLSAAVDGSQTPAAILADDVDASGGDVTAGVYFSGEFNAAAIVFGASHTASSVDAGLRQRSIFLKTGILPSDPV